MPDIHSWLSQYRDAVNRRFGSRVLFIGLQGSHARGEATATSDIDVVLILDHMEMDDLLRYRRLLAGLAEPERVCGFVAGRAELAAWSKPDLFHLYVDTKPIQGSLDGLIGPPSRASAAQAAHIGACNIHHACSHNLVHAEAADVLRALYKTAFFVMQADQYAGTGTCLGRRADLTADGGVMAAIAKPDIVSDDNLQEYSQYLLEWTAQLIRRHGRAAEA